MWLLLVFEVLEGDIGALEDVLLLLYLLLEVLDLLVVEDEVIRQFFLQASNFLLALPYVFLALSEIYVQVVDQFLEAVFLAFESVDGGLQYE